LIHIDHIKEKSKKGDESIENLWALCPNCHAKKTAGIIEINFKSKKVFENGREISIRDNHLFI
jgi:5-methylcytosine-specific restriction endonuclease McrA